jgi:acyl-CoA thioesterase-2
MQAQQWNAQDSISDYSGPLLDLLTVEKVAPDTFTGSCGAGWRPRVFGGQLIAQAVIAAGRDAAEGRPLHSLHANFIEGGNAAIPIEYRVEFVRDGRSFSSRIVRAWQGSRLLLHVFASFHADEQGVEHSVVGPDVPGPESLPGEPGGPLDVRAVTWLPTPAATVLSDQSLWLRVRDRLPDDPLVHTAAIAFMSDLTLGWAAWKAHGVHAVVPEMFSTSLDHSMWFHRAVRADDWLLSIQQSRISAAARGFNSAEIYAADRTLAVSVSQECVMRGPVTPG